ncbi:MAG TPA: uracil phosphoribosyltransferase [Vicinamibacterales bacterium]|nr:uracil phosphoribosyltransferase [Vicinamibacterales bacterium]
MALHLVTHPIAQDALVSLRDHTTPPGHFRRLAHRVGVIVAAEATRDLATESVSVQTPLESTSGRTVSLDIVIVAVLRAGLCLVEPLLDLLPRARVGHIGLRRDETSAQASCYSVHLPPGLSDSLVLLVDPMLATGGSAVMALDRLKAEGARNIRLLCVVAAPEGVALVERTHPDVDIYTPALDRQLNDRKYIVPGLGDFGDRLYGTGT